MVGASHFGLPQWAAAISIIAALITGSWTVYQWLQRRQEVSQRLRTEIESDEHRLTLIESGLDYHAKTLSDHGERIGRLEAK